MAVIDKHITDRKRADTQAAPHMRDTFHPHVQQVTASTPSEIKGPFGAGYSANMPSSNPAHDVTNLFHPQPPQGAVHPVQDVTGQSGPGAFVKTMFSQDWTANFMNVFSGPQQAFRSRNPRGNQA